MVFLAICVDAFDVFSPGRRLLLAIINDMLPWMKPVGLYNETWVHETGIYRTTSSFFKIVRH